MARKTFELPSNYDDLDDETRIKASEDIYRRQLKWKWGKILKELQDEGRL